MDEFSKINYSINEIFPKVWKVWNNNLEETNRLKLNGCQTMKPCDAHDEKQNFEKNYDFKDDHKEVDNMAEEILGNVLRRSNATSTNNSIDNLSIVDEVILLPNNISDEEISISSDDCVYAYRGADFEISDYKINNNDDETDFLEMDFEPDPTSEIDATNECNSLKYNCTTANKNINNQVMYKQSREDTNTNLKFFDNQHDHHQGTEDIVSHEESISIPVNVDDQAIATGAKPKKNCDKIMKIQKQNIPKPEYSSIVNDNKIIMESSYSDGEDTCIDCLENEFLSTTIGKRMDSLKCQKCQKNNCWQEMEDHVSINTSLNPIFDKTLKGNELNDHIQNIQRIKPSNINLLAPIKETASFSSIKVDDRTIIQALEQINVCFDKGIIRKYFEDFYKTREFSDVAELIIHTSKKNCDYKQIIKLVKLACKDNIDIKFTAIDNNSKATDVVQIKTSDILLTWAAQPDIERLKRIGGKFLQMNILGKVINLIRLAKQRNTISVGDFLLIPQYYKTGYICITKK